MVQKITGDDKAQMMTIEAFLGALLIIFALLFVVSQSPSSIQQSTPSADIQLYHYGEDIITVLKNSNSTHKDYDNDLQYYLSEKRFSELDEYIRDNLPDNVNYSIELDDGKRGFWIVRNIYPHRDSITVNSLVATKGFPIYGIGNLTGLFISNKSFENNSLIIPMDNNQTNVLTAYKLINEISEMGIPVYQLLQDPRGDDVLHPKWSIGLYTTDNPWNESINTYNLTNYAGGPYVIDAKYLTPTDRNTIKELAEHPIDVPSSKIDRIVFDTHMTSTDINLIFNMSDNSVRYVNLSAGSSNITLASTNASGTDSTFLDVDTTSVAFDDLNKSILIGIVMFNRATYDIEVSNVTLTSPPGVDIINVTIDGKNFPGPSSVVLNHQLLINDSTRNVMVHQSGEEFNYSTTTWLVRSPKIAVYPEAGTMMNYYSDSGLSFTVLDNNDILNGNLFFYDILFIPHTDSSHDITSANMPDDVAINIIDWISDGGTLLAECRSVDEIDSRIQEVDADNHSWDGFIGVRKYNSNNTVELIGSGGGDLDFDPYKLNYDNSNGSYLHPLAQTYTENGRLPGTDGATSAFELKLLPPSTPLRFNSNVSTMIVPRLADDSIRDYPKVTFIEAPFDKGTVIYIGGHDQSTYSKQRERLILNSIMYSTTAKYYSYGLVEMKVTMWYE